MSCRKGSRNGRKGRHPFVDAWYAVSPSEREVLRKFLDAWTHRLVELAELHPEVEDIYAAYADSVYNCFEISANVMNPFALRRLHAATARTQAARLDAKFKRTRHKRAVQTRAWYVPETSWNNNTLATQRATKHMLTKNPKNLKDPKDPKNQNAPPNLLVAAAGRPPVVVALPEDVGRCCISGDTLPVHWDEPRQTFVYANARRTKEGLLVHWSL